MKDNNRNIKDVVEDILSQMDDGKLITEGTNQQGLIVSLSHHLGNRFYKTKDDRERLDILFKLIVLCMSSILEPQYSRRIVPMVRR